VLVVTGLDRLARSTRDLLKRARCREAGERRLPLAQGQVSRHHDAARPTMLTILGGLAEFVRTLIRARTGEGRERAKARGVRFGRPKKLSAHQRHEALARIDAREAVTDVARTFRVDRATVYRLRPYRVTDIGAWPAKRRHQPHAGASRGIHGIQSGYLVWNIHRVCNWRTYSGTVGCGRVLSLIRIVQRNWCLRRIVDWSKGRQLTRAAHQRRWASQNRFPRVALTSPNSSTFSISAYTLGIVASCGRAPCTPTPAQSYAPWRCRPAACPVLAHPCALYRRRPALVDAGSLRLGDAFQLPLPPQVGRCCEARGGVRRRPSYRRTPPTSGGNRHSTSTCCWRACDAIGLLKRRVQQFANRPDVIPGATVRVAVTNTCQ
jgi:Resolvase, N terminal domain/Helix-turn-helix domain of resolvase